MQFLITTQEQKTNSEERKTNSEVGGFSKLLRIIFRVGDGKYFTPLTRWVGGWVGGWVEKWLIVWHDFVKFLNWDVNSGVF